MTLTASEELQILEDGIPGNIWKALLVLVTTSAAGLLLISQAFSLHSRSGVVAALFWTGFATILLPFFYILTRPWQRDRDTLFILGIGILSIYMIRLMRFKFEIGLDDEWAHFRQLIVTLATNNPYSYNSILPIVGHYPSLALVASTLVRMTGIPPMTMALIVIGVAKVLAIISVFYVAREFSKSRLTSALVTMLFFAAPTMVMFDSQYAYESLGLSLAVTAYAMALMHFRGKTKLSRRWWLTGFIFMAALVTGTHHLSSFFMLLSILFTLGWEAYQRDEPWPRLLLTFSIALTMIGIYTYTVARGALRYIGNQSIAPILDFLNGNKSNLRVPFQSSALQTPLFEVVMSLGGQLILALLTLLSLWEAYKRFKRKEPMTWVIVAGLVYPLTVLGRVIPGIQEAANRGGGFVILWMALLIGEYAPRPRLWGPKGRVLMAVLGTLFCFSGFISGSPYYSRYPTGFLVGSPNQIDGYEKEAARWMATHTDQHNTYCTDRLMSRVIGATSSATNVATIIPWTYVCKDMFHDHTWKSRDGYFLHLRLFDYVIVETRLSRNAPADGYLFDAEKGQTYKKPLPKADLEKFAHAYALRQVWRNKYVIIYHNDAVRWPIPGIMSPIAQPF